MIEVGADKVEVTAGQIAQENPDICIQLHDLGSMAFVRGAVEVSRTNARQPGSDARWRDNGTHWLTVEHQSVAEWIELLETVPRNALAVGALAVDAGEHVGFDDPPIGYALAVQRRGAVVLRGLSVAKGRGQPGLVGALMKAVLSKFEDDVPVVGYRHSRILTIMAERGFDNLAPGHAPPARFDGDIPGEMSVAELRALVDAMYTEKPPHRIVDLTSGTNY